MRILRFNGNIIDIDDNTAIGINLQTYDIKNPSVRKINVSNSFTIPVTNNNLAQIGWVGKSQSQDLSMYNEILCDYWINNTQYITSAKVKIEGVSDRIEVFIFQKPSVWDLLKKEKWEDFVNNYFDYLSIPKIGSPYTGSFSDFIDQYIVEGGMDGIFLPYYFSSKFDLNVTLNLAEVSSGGHFCTFIKNIFEYIEDTYSVDFFTSTNFDGNIFFDSVASGMYLMYRDLAAVADGGDIYFLIPSGVSEGIYDLDFEANETRDKSLYDFVISFMQIFNIIKTENAAGDEIKLRRFDDLENIAEVVEFSDNLTGNEKFIPFVENFNQNNSILYNNVEDGLNPKTNERIITCLNKNIDEEKDLFKINAYIPSFVSVLGIPEVMPDFRTKDSVKNFKFLINGNQVTSNITIETTDLSATQVSTIKNTLYPSAIYSLNSEYQLLDSALNYPKYYEFEKWVSSLDLLNFDFYKLYWIRQLNGSFFINKIKGFNPEKSRQATTFEVLKVSDRKPFNVEEFADYWVDGVGDVWTDGTGDEFYTF